MTLTREITIRPLQKNGKLYFRISELEQYFGCNHALFLKMLRGAINSCKPYDMVKIGPENVFVTMYAIKKIYEEIFSYTALMDFSTGSFADFYNLTREFYDDNGNINADVPEMADTTQRGYRKGNTILASAQQIAADFGVLPCDIYTELKIMQKDYLLAENVGILFSQKTEIVNGAYYNKAYFSHIGLLSIALMLKEKRGYSSKKVINGFVNCMHNHFDYGEYASHKMSDLEYAEMLTLFFRRYISRNRLSVEENLDLKDMLERFKKMR